MALFGTRDKYQAVILEQALKSHGVAALLKCDGCGEDIPLPWCAVHQDLCRRAARLRAELRKPVSGG